MKSAVDTEVRVETLRWSRRALASLQLDHTNQAPVIALPEQEAAPQSLDIWDAWPLADRQGKPVTWENGELWFALATPPQDDPEDRHHLARIHHFHRVGEAFHYLGQTFPEGTNPGAREWSGSALLDKDGTVTLYFTAAGRRGDSALTYHQRLFMRQTRLAAPNVFADWSSPQELFAADGRVYRPADENEGEAGSIKAFRDPAHFTDDDGTRYILFTGSSASNPGTHDGVIGLARVDDEGGYHMLDPLVEATGTSNELERPHIVRYNGLYYLFWSTQDSVFAPGIVAPTGLYGAVASALAGPWRLLNTHGLVMANPKNRPTQAYSWWVLPDLSVTSFVDYWGCETRPAQAARRQHFGGQFAPFFRITLDGDRSKLAGSL